MSSSRPPPFECSAIAFPVSGRGLTVVVTMVVIAALLTVPVSAQSAAPGGFVELATSTDIRPHVMPTLPPRGKFTFPAPYNTVGIRLTNATDCAGRDCVDYVGYSYWPNSNNHVDSNTMLIFLTLDRARGGKGPTLFQYDKQTDAVTVVGPLFEATNPLSFATGEGWHWSLTRPNALYVNDGPRLYRYDVMAHQFETVFDASLEYGANRYIWQTHSSTDDRVHSATLRSTVTFEMLGCMVYREDTQQFSFFAKIGDFDECQVDKSGRWLLIKENVDGAYGEDNRIIDLESGAETIFLDQQGAAGHSDNGYGYMVAADNWYSLPGAVRVWSFDQPFPGMPPQGQLVYHTTDWALDIGHISHTNARPGVPLQRQYACGGAAVRATVPRANEIVCFRLDGSLQVLVVAPTMTNLNAKGGGRSDYAKLPKGNLDITGQYFIWTSNTGGNRLDAFVVRVPSQLLTSAVEPIRGFVDFNGDGKADILWRHSSGTVCIWLMDGASLYSAGCPGSVGADWTIQGIGDFNGDGKSDILWRHSSGAICIWFMDGTSLTGSGCPGSVGWDWTIQNVGDFNGDGKADILWRHASGLVCIWFMNGSSLASSSCPGTVGLDWTFQGVGDFNGDGKADILWRHSSGLVCIWLMDGASITRSGCPSSAAPEWSIQGVGDVDGDGKADILWRNASGLLCIWHINGTSLSSSGCPGTVALDWSIQDVADFNADGKADILWRHSSGLVCTWFMDGTNVSSSGCPGSPGNDWRIQ